MDALIKLAKMALSLLPCGAGAWKTEVWAMAMGTAASRPRANVLAGQRSLAEAIFAALRVQHSVNVSENYIRELARDSIRWAALFEQEFETLRNGGEK